MAIRSSTAILAVAVTLGLWVEEQIAGSPALVRLLDDEVGELPLEARMHRFEPLVVLRAHQDPELIRGIYAIDRQRLSFLHLTEDPPPNLDGLKARTEDLGEEAFDQPLESLLDARSLLWLSGARPLRTTRRSDGIIPGEAAVALADGLHGGHRVDGDVAVDQLPGERRPGDVASERGDDEVLRIDRDGERLQAAGPGGGETRPAALQRVQDLAAAIVGSCAVPVVTARTEAAGASPEYPRQGHKELITRRKSHRRKTGVRAVNSLLARL